MKRKYVEPLSEVYLLQPDSRLLNKSMSVDCSQEYTISSSSNIYSRKKEDTIFNWNAETNFEK